MRNGVNEITTGAGGRNRCLKDSKSCIRSPFCNRRYLPPSILQSIAHPLHAWSGCRDTQKSYPDSGEDMINDCMPAVIQYLVHTQSFKPTNQTLIYMKKGNQKKQEKHHFYGIQYVHNSCKNTL